MHTFGAMTSKRKLAQHTHEPETTVSAGTSTTAMCLTNYTEDTHKADASADQVRFELPMALPFTCKSMII